jgi:hypothetical protein
MFFIGENMATFNHPSLPLEQETRSALPTAEAAFHLNRAQQTLRAWACRESGPIRPVRINGRLAWPVASIRAVLEGK